MAVIGVGGIRLLGTAQEDAIGTNSGDGTAPSVAVQAAGSAPAQSPGQVGHPGLSVEPARTAPTDARSGEASGRGWYSELLERLGVIPNGRNVQVVAMSGTTPDGQNHTPAPSEPKGTIGDLPPLRAGESRALSVNTASGAKDDKYRRADNRTALGELIRTSGASFVGLQENYRGATKRTGTDDTALSILTAAYGSFGVFAGHDGRRYTRNGYSHLSPEEFQCAPPCQISNQWNDELVVYRTEDGWLVEGTSEFLKTYKGDSNVAYGNAMYLGPEYEIVGAYNEVLPNSEEIFAGGENSATELRRRYENGELTADAWSAAMAQRRADDDKFFRDEEHAEYERELKRFNDCDGSFFGLRPGFTCGDRPKAPSRKAESRSALVTVARGPEGGETAFINVHLSTEDDIGSARAQLQHLAALVDYQRGQGRDVVLTGDFNKRGPEVEKTLGNHGLVLAQSSDIGDKHADGQSSDIDQVWVTRGSEIVDSHAVSSEGRSDHDGIAEVRLR
ncbi:MAG: hypothetical protein R3A78_03130 [Polyangiales bacterium]